MKAWFLLLEDREQKFVIAAAIFVVLAVLYAGLWMPLDRSHKRVTAGVELWQQSYDQLRPLKGRIGSNSGPRISQQNLNQPLVVVVDSSLRVRKLNESLQRSQPTGDDIRVEFENVSFDDLVLWLGDIQNQYALQVKSGSFTAGSSKEPGRVNAQLTLGR